MKKIRKINRVQSRTISKLRFSETKLLDFVSVRVFPVVCSGTIDKQEILYCAVLHRDKKLLYPVKRSNHYFLPSMIYERTSNLMFLIQFGRCDDISCFLGRDDRSFTFLHPGRHILDISFKFFTLVSSSNLLALAIT